MKILLNSRSCAILITVSMVTISSCDGRRLCCGYSTVEDWTSDVSIARDGHVVFQNVSAIIEREDFYFVEIRDPIEDAPRLAFGECGYAHIDKETGARSEVVNLELRSALNSMLSNGDAELILQTQFSCLSEQP